MNRAASAACSAVARRDVDETNRRFYDALWADARLVEPERFNTWPVIRPLVASSHARLEVAPGLRPRLPIAGTHFVERSASALEKLRSRGAIAVRGLVTSIPFAAEAFDLVCAFDILEHVVDDEAALAELARVASNGSVLLLSVPLHAARWTAFDDAVGHYRRYEPAPLRSRLAAHGYTIEWSAPFGMQPRSSRLLDLGMWFLEHRRRQAMWWYDRVFMPLGLHAQKPLSLRPGMGDVAAYDEVVVVCRKGTGTERHDGRATDWTTKSGGITGMDGRIHENDRRRNRR